MEENLIYLVGFFILIVLSLIAVIIKLETRVSKLLKGKKAKSLEDTLLYITEEIKRISEEEKRVDIIIKDLDKRIKTSVTGVGTIRFNPFTNSGGNQSFAIALLNENGDGVVVSTLHARERTSVFAKPIKKYKSDFELTKEESEALEKAK